MIYLDTHVVLWLYALKGKRLSKRACQLIEESATIFISPMVLLELDYIYEIGRIRVESDQIYYYLEEKIGLKTCARAFLDVIHLASKQTWTRDPFDRIITAQAALADNPIITKDRFILQNYPYAEW